MCHLPNSGHFSCQHKMHSGDAGLHSLLHHPCPAKRVHWATWGLQMWGAEARQQGSQVLFGEKAGLLLLWSKKLLRDVSRIAYEWRGQQVYKPRAVVPFSQLKKKKELISIWFLAWEQVCLWIIHRRAGHTSIWRPRSLKANETQSMKITQQILSSIT